MQMCWEVNLLLQTQVPLAPAFPTAHLLTSLLVLPHPDSPFHCPFGTVLMLLLQTSAILMDNIELTSCSVSMASLIKKEKIIPSQCHSWKVNLQQSGRCNRPISDSFCRASHMKNWYVLWKEALHYFYFIIPLLSFMYLIWPFSQFIVSDFFFPTTIRCSFLQLLSCWNLNLCMWSQG